MTCVSKPYLITFQEICEKISKEIDPHIDIMPLVDKIHCSVYSITEKYNGKIYDRFAVIFADALRIIAYAKS